MKLKPVNSEISNSNPEIALRLVFLYTTLIVRCLTHFIKSQSKHISNPSNLNYNQ